MPFGVSVAGYLAAMRVVVVGASGNVGTSVLRSLAAEPAVDSVLGLCRRIPDGAFPKTEWRSADVSRTPLKPLFQGADAVVHLAWLIQPGRDRELLRAVNVRGSARVFRAAAAAGVENLVYASSVGTYAQGPKDRRVTETWPTTGIPTSLYSSHKAEVERLLDRFEHEHPRTRVVRLRPGLIFKRDAASEIRRLFAGPLVPGFLIRPELIPVLPYTPRLALQAVHSHDVGEAYRLALTREVQGAFNVAAEPVLDSVELARIVDARRLPAPVWALRAGVSLSFRLHLQPCEPGWLDMGLGVPLMDSARAHDELGWRPEHSAADALEDLLEGIRAGAGLDTPPLEPATVG